MVDADSALAGMTQPLKLIRYAEGSYDKARWVDGPSTTTTIDAYIEPAPGEEVLLLPEGERGKEAILVITTTKLRTLREGDSPQSADYLEWEGRQFKVVKIEPFKMGVLDHYEALAVRKNP